MFVCRSEPAAESYQRAGSRD